MLIVRYTMKFSGHSVNIINPYSVALRTAKWLSKHNHCCISCIIITMKTLPNDTQSNYFMVEDQDKKCFLVIYISEWLMDK